MKHWTKEDILLNDAKEETVTVMSVAAKVAPSTMKRESEVFFPFMIPK